VYSPDDDPWLDWDPFWRAIDRLRFDLELREVIDALGGDGSPPRRRGGAAVTGRPRACRPWVNALRAVKRSRPPRRARVGAARPTTSAVRHFSRCVFQVMRERDRGGMTRTLLALLLHERKNGAPPERLEDLGPTNRPTLDPFLRRAAPLPPTGRRRLRRLERRRKTFGTITGKIGVGRRNGPGSGERRRPRRHLGIRCPGPKAP
jgi:hypothetical protein